MLSLRGPTFKKKQKKPLYEYLILYKFTVIYVEINHLNPLSWIMLENISPRIA